MNEFILGPLQQRWLESLENNPERQMRRFLGEMLPNGDYKACCLGEAGMICGVIEVKKGRFFNGDSTAYLNSYKAIGLRNNVGPLLKPVFKNNERFRSLANMNDDGWTWPEIAAEIRKDPANFFVESK